MARPIIVEPGTERLQIVLMRGCEAVEAAEVTLTVTRKGETPHPSTTACPDACRRPWPRAHDVPEGRWGGCHSSGESNCSECHGQAMTMAPYCSCDGMQAVSCPVPSKTYIAESVVRGVATFRIDLDLAEAPAGWYLGRVAVAGCEVAALTIWMKSGRTTGHARRA